jgi:RimJ/RimL family protein N-acetyltransferase
MLQGDLIVLRAVERDDLPNFVRWLNDETVLEYFGQILPLSLEQEEQWYEGTLQASSVCAFSVEFEGQHVGGAGLNQIQARHRSAEVGLFIGVPGLWDRGLGSDVMRALLHYGFQQLNLHRIYLRVFSENRRAVHLYEKLGFQHEGLWRQAEFRSGCYHDILWMSLLRNEWTE